MASLSQCPDCGATFSPGEAACPECGMELYDEPAEGDNAAAADQLYRTAGKMLAILRQRFDYNDEAIPTDSNSSGFLLTDRADGVTYEVRIQVFDLDAWLKG